GVTRCARGVRGVLYWKVPIRDVPTQQQGTSPMSRRRLSALALTAAAALALTACSTGGEQPAASSAGDEYGLVTDGTLTVATEGTYRPFTFHDETGELVGFDVEIAEAVAEKLRLEISFQETQWDAIFAGLDAGRFDLIANQVSINPEREE